MARDPASQSPAQRGQGAQFARTNAPLHRRHVDCSCAEEAVIDKNVGGTRDCVLAIATDLFTAGVLGPAAILAAALRALSPAHMRSPAAAW